MKLALTQAQVRAIEERLGIQFRDTRLLERAFTHRSCNGDGMVEKRSDYERLEFLGDKALGFLLGRYLHERLPDAPEGLLTDIFSCMASNDMLAKVSEGLGLQEFVLLSRGERQTFDKGENGVRKYMLACIFEALIGALVLDRNIGIAQLFLENTLFPYLDGVISGQEYIVQKSLLQELCHSVHKITPQYKVIKVRNVRHNKKEFLVGAFLGDRCLGEGYGANKSAASHEAAKAALQNEFHIVFPGRGVM